MLTFFHVEDLDYSVSRAAIWINKFLLSLCVAVFVMAVMAVMVVFLIRVIIMVSRCLNVVVMVVMVFHIYHIVMVVMVVHHTKSCSFKGAFSHKFTQIRHKQRIVIKRGLPRLHCVRHERRWRVIHRCQG